MDLADRISPPRSSAIGPDGRALSLSVGWDGGTEFKRVEDKPAS